MSRIVDQLRRTLPDDELVLAASAVGRSRLPARLAAPGRHDLASTVPRADRSWVVVTTRAVHVHAEHPLRWRSIGARRVSFAPSDLLEVAPLAAREGDQRVVARFADGSGVVLVVEGGHTVDELVAAFVRLGVGAKVDR